MLLLQRTRKRLMFEFEKWGSTGRLCWYIWKTLRSDWIMKHVVILAILSIGILAVEDIWLKDEWFDPLAPFEPDWVVLYAPKGCILDTIPGVRSLTLVQILDREWS